MNRYLLLVDDPEAQQVFMFVIDAVCMSDATASLRDYYRNNRWETEGVTFHASKLYQHGEVYQLLNLEVVMERKKKPLFEEIVESGL